MWLFAVLVVLVLGAVAVVAAGRGAPMVEEYGDRVDSTVPESGPVTADDLRRIRFPLAVRGYRMQEVDALLDRLATEREEAERAEVAPAGTVDPDPSADGGAERA